MNEQKNEKTDTGESDDAPIVLEKIIYNLAKKWIAGSNRDEAILNAKKANNEGLNVILNFLGEEYTDKKTIDSTVSEYSSLLNLMNDNKIMGSISIKPTQVGLVMDYENCLKNLLKISNIAKSFNRFMWIDIESYSFVEDTLTMYLEIFKKNNNTGVVIQSYLKRSMSDVMHLVESGANIRLVKGAYEGNESIAYTSNSEKTSNFEKLMGYIFEHTKNQEIIAVATHDSTLIEKAIQIDREYRSIGKKKNLEFQFLKGIRDSLKKSMVHEGYVVCEYMPYGQKWLPYSIRRIKERKRNLLLLGRSLFGN